MVDILCVSTCRADYNSIRPVFDSLRARGVDAAMAIPANHPGLASMHNEGLRVPLWCWPPVSMEPPLFAIDCMAGVLTMDDWPRKGVVIVGDRMEALSVATAFRSHDTRIAHIAGGDTSLGSLDQYWRDAITSLADLHFTTNAKAADKVWAIAQGLGRGAVFCKGSPAIDAVLALRDEAAAEPEFRAMMGLAPGQPFALINWQPETPYTSEAAERTLALGAAIAALDIATIAVGPGADSGADHIQRIIGRSVNVWVGSMAPRLYIEGLMEAVALIGNSSSGYYEAPMLGTPVIDIGTRQQGRYPGGQAKAITRLADESIPKLPELVLSFAGQRYPSEFFFGRPGVSAAIAETIIEEWSLK